ncbi:MAG: hypothetical protein AAF317_12410 [Pseudomonadota bacterium]
MTGHALTPRKIGSATRIAAVAAMVVLAACDDETAKQAQPTASSTEQAGALASNASWLDLSTCGQPPTGTVNYQLGGTSISISQALVRRVILPKTDATKNIDPAKPLAVQVPPGTGCPDAPLQIAAVMTSSQFATDLLEGSVTMFPVAPGLVENYSKVVTQLRSQRPENACQAEKDGLIVCFGQEKQGEATTDVAYVIASSPQANLNSGAPLFARCEIQDSKPVGCNLGDLASPQVFYDATLARLPRSAADLQAAHRAVNQQFASRAG